MTYIIAEAGTGHVAENRGVRFALAHGFIQNAARAGANAVKFQMFIADEPLFCQMPGDEARMKRWARTALTLDDWQDLTVDAQEHSIDLLWSVFQPTCVEWMKELKPRYVKVASRAAKTYPYSPGVKYLVSVSSPGMYQPNVSHLYCVPKYPAPLAECGFRLPYAGLSDHSGTVWPGLGAIYAGAQFLEVHFKIPGADMGNDEPVCLTTDQLKLLCEARDAVAAMRPYSG